MRQHLRGIFGGVPHGVDHALAQFQWQGIQIGERAFSRGDRAIDIGTDAI